jgi:hypothetical protein
LHFWLTTRRHWLALAALTFAGLASVACLKNGNLPVVKRR